MTGLEKNAPQWKMFPLNSKAGGKGQRQNLCYRARTS
jgi:hypothetical protein